MVFHHCIKLLANLLNVNEMCPGLQLYFCPALIPFTTYPLPPIIQTKYPLQMNVVYLGSKEGKTSPILWKFRKFVAQF